MHVHQSSNQISAFKFELEQHNTSEVQSAQPLANNHNFHPRLPRDSEIMSVTPVSEKTVSMTAKDQQGPTPKNEFKKPVNQR